MIDALYHSEHVSDYMYIVLLPWNITDNNHSCARLTFRILGVIQSLGQ